MCIARMEEARQIKRGQEGKWVTRAIYGFAIDKDHTDIFADKEDLERWDEEEHEDIFEDILDEIKITEKTKSIRYYVTDFEYSDNGNYGDTSTLIIGAPLNSLKCHYNGVMSMSMDTKELDGILSDFIEANPLFGRLKPEILVYTDRRK